MISFDNLSLQFGGQKIFDQISLMVSAKDRIGLVGKNGAGKSTMLKILIGEQLPDEGAATIPGDITLGYLPQQLSYKDCRTVFSETMTAFSELKHLEKEIEHLNVKLTERTDYESDAYMEIVELLSDKTDRLNLLNSGNTEALAEQTLKGLGFEPEDFERPTKEFSGGWRMRIELAKILLRSPDIFLLDEPTNHLDIESIQWLENFLKNYHGAVILISHDRAFLDAVTSRTVEISLGKLYDYRVPYTKYTVLRKERLEQQFAAYRNQQKQIEETRDFIERFRYKASKAVQVQSRIKQLDKLDIIEIDEEDLSSINIKFPPAPRSGSIVFEAKDLTKAYGTHVVLDDIDIEIERGEKLAFVGRNGEGKTTLSRIIIGELEAKGKMKLGHNVKIGYFAQNQDELLDDNKTIFQTIDDIAVGEVRTKIRDILAAFLFRGEDVDKKVKVLSGGEKSRLSMAKLLLEPYNLLVLDEPTNHLDMRSKDILKQALLAYDGTLILVSHDRDFLNGLTDKIFEFRNKKIKEYRVSIYEFLKKKNLDHLNDLNLGVSSPAKPVEEETDASNKNKQNYLERKEADKKIRKAERQVEEIEESIAKLEDEQAEIETKISEGANDPSIFEKYENVKKALNTLMWDWEAATNQLELKRKERDL
ncbi:MAG: ABC-F family ATP-binding cassette domain-containing protein [Bacteroidales bacterium]|nr:ABC-F family ATP-binding cassette domain-containing protein [Bacteroidales bacterium]MBN2819258.1 ABC-F family ATP-binding cassette domain-containing protein [Bacteroidales bacterium]